MRLAFICLLFFSSEQAFSQAFTIKSIYKSDSNYVFPVVVSSQRPVIAKKINTVIKTGLGVDPNINDPFDSVGFEDEWVFETGVVNDRVLSIVIVGSHSGAGFHVQRLVYNFDSRNAEQIDVDKLFGADGYGKLRKLLYKRWKESIKKNLDDYAADEFKECLVGAEKISEVDVERMTIMEQGIRFWAGYCLDGSQAEMDRTKGPHELSLGQMLPLLTPYGYSLFVDQPGKGPFATLLRGTIDNKYPISLTLHSGKDAGTITGMIVYDRVGQPINVGGVVNGNQFVIHELDDSNNPLSNIEVAWDGSKLSGTFFNLKSKKSMSFAASTVK